MMRPDAHENSELPAPPRMPFPARVLMNDPARISNHRRHEGGGTAAVARPPASPSDSHPLGRSSTDSSCGS